MLRSTHVFGLRLSLTLGFSLAVHAHSARAQSAAPVANRMFEIEGANVSSLALSPDGKWVVYSQSSTEQESRIFVRSVDGGPATALTPSGRTNNGHPHFSPAGDRVFYDSSLPARANENASYIMSVPFDTKTGRATGPGRQVTIEPVRTLPNTKPAVSPDGKWIAYIQCCGAQRVRVVSTNGGNARTLAEHADTRTQIVNLAWTDDGRGVLYVIPQPGGTAWHLMRASLTGAAPVLVRRSEGPVGLLASGGHRSAYLVSFGQNQRQRELRVRGADGTIQYRVRLPESLDGRLSSWSADGRTYIGGVRDIRAVLRIASLEGGPVRALTAGGDYDWPDGWSSDGRTVYYETAAEGNGVLGSVSIDATNRGRLEWPKGGDYGSWAAVVGRYAIEVTGWIDSTRQVVRARNIDDGTVIPITSAKYAPRAQMFIRGAGGTYATDGDAYLYFEKAGDSIALHSVVPGQPHRVLRSFPATRTGQLNLAVHAGRVIYAERGTDSLRFMFAPTAAATPRAIATLPSAADAGEIAWSKDGRHVAFHGGGGSVYVMRLTADGSPLGTPTLYQLPFDYMYELSLLNDGRRLTMIAQPRGGPNAVVALVSLDNPAHPTILNEGDGTSTWGHLMSPDGKWTAYSAELPPRATTVFRVDFPPIKR